MTIIDGREHIKIRQSSMQFSDSLADIRADVTAAIPPASDTSAPDVIGWSETTKTQEVYPLVAGRADKYDYSLYVPSGDCGFSIHPRNRVTEEGFIAVLDPNGDRDPGPNYSAKSIVWTAFLTPANNHVVVHITHWLTGFRLDTNPGPENERERLFTTQTDAMIRAVVEHGSASRVSFWQGDTNVGEDADTGFDHSAIHYRFARAGLTSVYDELHDRGKLPRNYPGTHGPITSSTIDVIGGYTLDKRVRAERVKVHPPRNSDHNMVDAVYSIAPRTP